MVKKLLYLPLFIVLLAGCKQKDLTPSWLKINQFTLTTNEPTEGANSHGITDAWIFMDGKSLGVHELPCNIPVLDEGEHSFFISPGIKNNGISATRIRYPFYESFEIDATLKLNDTLELSPGTTYKSNTEFAFIEDFEDAGISLTKGPSSDTDVVFIDETTFPDLVQYGSNCGGIFLNTTDELYTGKTSAPMFLPKAEDVFLEIDYRNDNTLSMGVVAIFPDGSSSQHTPLISMNAQKSGQEVWKKIYIDLKEDVNFDPAAVSHEIYFFTTLDTNKTQGNVYIDNIKVVHYQ